MHPFLKYGLTLGSVGLSVTVAYKIYSNYRQSSSHKEICELLFTNPSASCCLGQKARANCANPYCIKKNSAKIIRHIEAAKHSISLAMLIFTYRQFMEALIRAHKRGVTVRVITDRGMEHSTGSTIKQLSDNGKTDWNPLRKLCNFFISTQIQLYLLLQIFRSDSIEAASALPNIPCTTNFVLLMCRARMMILRKKPISVEFWCLDRSTGQPMWVNFGG